MRRGPLTCNLRMAVPPKTLMLVHHVMEIPTAFMTMDGSGQITQIIRQQETPAPRRKEPDKLSASGYGGYLRFQCQVPL